MVYYKGNDRGIQYTNVKNILKRVNTERAAAMEAAALLVLYRGEGLSADTAG